MARSMAPLSSMSCLLIASSCMLLLLLPRACGGSTSDLGAGTAMLLRRGDASAGRSQRYPPSLQQMMLLRMDEGPQSVKGGRCGGDMWRGVAEQEEQEEQESEQESEQEEQQEVRETKRTGYMEGQERPGSTTMLRLRGGGRAWIKKTIKQARKKERQRKKRNVDGTNLRASVRLDPTEVSPYLLRSMDLHHHAMEWVMGDRDLDKLPVVKTIPITSNGTELKIALGIEDDGELDDSEAMLEEGGEGSAGEGKNKKKRGGERDGEERREKGGGKGGDLSSGGSKGGKNDRSIGGVGKGGGITLSCTQPQR